MISGNEAGTSGSPTTDATGIVDGAFGFGGDGDYLTLPEFAPGDGGVTVSVWINADNWGGVSSLVFWGGPVPDHTSIELWVDGETPGFFYWTQRLSTG